MSFERGAEMVFGQIPLNDAIIGRYTRDEYRARAYAVRHVLSFCVAIAAEPACRTNLEIKLSIVPIGYWTDREEKRPNE